MQQYKWIPGSDTSGSPIYEVLASSDMPLSVEQLIDTTGMSKEEVVAHLDYGVVNKVVMQIVVGPTPKSVTELTLVKPALALPAPERAEKVANETSMVDFLIRGNVGL